MGKRYTAICNDCNEKFIVRRGGGLFFHLLHCDTCGKEKTISIGDLRVEDRTMTEVERVEYLAGQCSCGDPPGGYKVGAPPRCPKCRSTEHKMDPSEPMAMYD